MTRRGLTLEGILLVEVGWQPHDGRIELELAEVGHALNRRLKQRAVRSENVIRRSTRTVRELGRDFQ